MDLRLIVIRTPDPHRLATFYTILGLNFEYHQHNNSPFHFSAFIGKTVFEIFPLAKNQTEADSTLRLGFEIDDFDQLFQQLNELDVRLLAPPTQTEWGITAIVQDPDGRKIELYKNEK